MSTCMSNANVEGSRPHLEVPVDHTEDQAADDTKRDGPTETDHPVRHP